MDYVALTLATKKKNSGARKQNHSASSVPDTTVPRRSRSNETTSRGGVTVQRGRTRAGSTAGRQIFRRGGSEQSHRHRGSADEELAPELRPRNVRRALTHVGGKITFRGDGAFESELRDALSVTNDEQQTRPHLHGFHSYPARLHPLTAHTIIERLSPAGGTVLDPFCGSGTVLLEALAAGRAALGVDANPLSVRLARFKTTRISRQDRAELQALGLEVVRKAEERRIAKSGPTRRYGPKDLELFEIHTLMELDGLRAAIKETESPKLHQGLMLVLSSILTKASKKAGDSTRRGYTARRLKSGFIIQLFEDRVSELLTQFAQFDDVLEGVRRRSCRVFNGDARILQDINPNHVDLVMCSPPYPGVYNYLEHHEARLRWLGLRAETFTGAEIGAKRHLDRLGGSRAKAQWEQDLQRVLQAVSQKLKPGGYAAFVLADSAVEDTVIRADDSLADLAPGAGLQTCAIASQERPVFDFRTERAYGRRARHEHLAVLVKDGGETQPTD